MAAKKNFAMLAQPFEEKRVILPVAVEPKLDGLRLLAFYYRGEVKFYSRSGKSFPALDGMAVELGLRLKRDKTVKGFVLDGEVVSGKFHESSGSIRRKYEQATDAVYHVFDYVPLSDFMGRSCPLGLVVRRNALIRTVDRADYDRLKLVPQRIVNRVEDIQRLFELFRRDGYEGVIVKDLLSRYEHKRSFSWLKVKNKETADCKVVGSFIGEGKHAGRLGGLIVRYGRRQVRVGTGFSDAQREEFWKGRRLMVGRIAEIEFHEETHLGSLREPRFIRLRDVLAKGVKE